MKIFVSWSGTSSRMVAEALSDWLQRVIQAVKPFYSPHIDKGAKWSNEIDGALEDTRFGIICLTPDNLKSTWIHYEAGALSKTKDASIWTFLLSLKPSDVKQPLGRFQHTLAEKADVLKLLKSINTKLVEVGIDSLKEVLLEEIFEESWPKLESKLQKACEEISVSETSTNDSSAQNIRNEGDKLDEILEILRNQQRRELSPIVATEGFLKHRDSPRYERLRFRMTTPESKYSASQVAEYTAAIFSDIGRVTVSEEDRGILVIVDFDKSRTSAEVRERLRSLQVKTEYEINTFRMFRSDETSRIFQLRV